MGLLDFPNPASWVTSIKDDDQKRATINAVTSAAYSAWIAFLWRSGQRNLFGFGPALADAAVSTYLSLHVLQKKGFLALSLPQDMLKADVLAKFVTEEETK
jgi:hypothetical protein